MLKPDDSLIIHFDDQMTRRNGKMGHGTLRFSSNQIVACVDRYQQGGNSLDILGYGPDCPIVKNIDQAFLLGGNVMVLGMAPSGGRLPRHMFEEVDRAVAGGLSIANGLHQPLADRYPTLLPGQWIWDIRKEPEGLDIASGKAASLKSQRVLVVGTDMAVGKMTTAIEISRAAKLKGVRTEFLATGQIGVFVSGRGIVLDAIRVDYACGAVESLVVDASDADLLIIEGQGSILHPGSTSTLPLLRGSCPTHLVLCHRMGSNTVEDHKISIPPLPDLIELYEDLASACGTFPKPKTVGIALDTSNLNDKDARECLNETSSDLSLPAVDPLRYGVTHLVDALLKS